MASQDIVLTRLDPNGKLDPLFCGPHYDVEFAGKALPRRIEDLHPLPRMQGQPQQVDRWVPCWRWNEAMLAKGRPEYSHRGGDASVHRDLVPFLHAQDKNSNYMTELDINARWPELTWARRHWLNPKSQIRHYIEAMVLAGAPRSLLANILDVEEAHIVWFEKAFWDIRPYLSCRDRIVLSVVRPAIDQIGNGDRSDSVWKLLVAACDFNYQDFMGFTHPTKAIPAHVEDKLRVALRNETLTQAFAMAHGRPVGRRTDEIILTAFDMFEKHRQVDAATGGVKKGGVLETKEFKEAMDSLGMAKLDLKFTGVEPNDYMDVSTAFNNRVRSGQYLQYEKPVMVGAADDN